MAPTADELAEGKALFTHLDRDCVGVLRHVDLAGALKATDPEAWSDERLARLLADADVDGDGAIGLDDFLTFVSKDAAGQLLRSELQRAGSFVPRNVPGLRIEVASDEDLQLTRTMVADPVFHGGEIDGLDTVQAYTAYASLGTREWRINVAAAPCPAGRASGRVALFMHGHGPCCCMSAWGRFWALMHRKGYHVLAFDAPGFGRSSGATGQTMPWRDWDADLVLLLLRGFGVGLAQGRVTVFGQCMGGAMFLRALQKAPEAFGAWHVLHNCTIGTWPQELHAVLRAKGGGLRSFWWYDPDHMREANVYREFTQLAAKSPELCRFVDLQRDCDLPAFFSFGRVGEPRLARGDHATVLGFCPDAVADLVAFATAPPRPTGGALRSLAPKKTMLQLGRENKDFKVFVRVRPPLRRERGLEECVEVSEMQDPKGRTVEQILVNRAGQASSEFVFERIFRPESSQEDVWAALRSSLDFVGALLQGVGATIFAYGQTGSGKTHTIDGEGSGLTARVVEDLYSRLPAAHRVCCRYVQLYNEEFYDLLAPSAKLSQDGTGALAGARVLQPASAAELLASFREGAVLRASGRTDMNDSSSRSHAILILQIAPPDVDVASSLATRPQLFVVDLAGSERVKRSGAVGARLVEAVAINQSLFALSQVATALVENNGRPRAHIPYRDSALTQLLRNSLGGSARTALVACISPTVDSVEETFGTLKFATCATHVQNRAEQMEQEAAQEQEDEQQFDGVLAESAIDFATGEAFVKTSAGSVHCFGNISPGESDRAVVVMLHYYGKDVDAGMWRFMFEPLAAAGHKYLAPSMPGHGQSSGDRGSSKPEDYARDGGPAAVVLELLNACGVGRAVILGYDWGGGVACAFAAKYPARVSKLIPWCASVRDPKEMERYQKRKKKAGGACLVLWAKNDNWHPWRKGADLAAALDVKVSEVRLRHKGGGDDVRQRTLELLAAPP